MDIIMKQSLVMAVISTIVALDTVRSCPTTCTCDITTVTCQFASEFPRNISRNTTHLIIKWSTITNISSEDFEALNSLEILDLSQNIISYVHPNTFNQLTNLYYISLERNDLRTLDKRTFVDLRLVRLYLSDNRRLENIHPEAFFNTSVTQLYLQRCFLNTTSILTTLSSLGQSVTTLDISDNGQDISFEGMTLERFNLEELTLQNNGIGDLAFLSQSAIEKLDLSGNSVGDKVWDVLRFIPTLRELIIRDVGLRGLNDSIHSNTLLVLNVADNNISSLESQHIAAFPNLYTLILKNNSISSLPGDLVAHVPRLVVLDASHNKISSFHENMISGLTLRVLDLSHNLLTQLAEDAADVFNDILSVDLRGNPLHCNCQLLWLAEWMRTLPADRRDIEVGTCGTPEGNAGKEISDMPDSDFVCRGPVVVLAASVGFRLGDQATLDCKAKGDPRPDLALYMETTPIQTSAAVSRGHQGDRLFYQMNEFNCSQIGNYTCRATNIVGREEETVHLGASLEHTCELGWSKSDLDTTVTDPTGGDAAGVKGKRVNKAAYIIPVVICVAIVIFFAVCALFVVWNRRSKRKYDVRESENEMQEDLEEAGLGNAGFNRDQPRSRSASPAKRSVSSSRHTRSLQGSPEKRSLGSDRVHSVNASPAKENSMYAPSGDYHQTNNDDTHVKQQVIPTVAADTPQGRVVNNDKQIGDYPQSIRTSPKKQNNLTDTTDILETIEFARDRYI